MHGHSAWTSLQIARLALPCLLSSDYSHKQPLREETAGSQRLSACKLESNNATFSKCLLLTILRHNQTRKFSLRFLLSFPLRLQTCSKLRLLFPRETWSNAVFWSLLNLNLYFSVREQQTALKFRKHYLYLLNWEDIASPIVTNSKYLALKSPVTNVMKCAHTVSC